MLCTATHSGHRTNFIKTQIFTQTNNHKYNHIYTKTNRSQCCLRSCSAHRTNFLNTNTNTFALEQTQAFHHSLLTQTHNFIQKKAYRYTHCYKHKQKYKTKEKTHIYSKAQTFAHKQRQDVVFIYSQKGQLQTH